jgi:DNA sulfur modification protein DndB
MSQIEFTIPAVRGIQGGHTYYTTMCPVRLLPRLFPIVVDHGTGASHQSFRKVNVKRVGEIAKDILAHHQDLCLAAVTISVEHPVRFDGGKEAGSKLPTTGRLFIPLEARLTIVDGIHRIYSLQRALRERPSLGDECVAMVVHVDPDGSRRGRIFSDVKRYQRRAAQSFRIGVDDRDEVARITRKVVDSVPVFVDAIEMEKTTISNRSRKLFTLSALYQANRVLLMDQKHRSYKQRLKLATEFWTEIAAQIPGWAEIANGDGSAAELRAGFIHCHAIGLAAIARAGRALLVQSPTVWKKRLGKLSSLDWSRTNSKLWEGRAMIGGRLSKSSSAVARAGNAVKRHLGIALTPEEQGLER